MPSGAVDPVELLLHVCSNVLLQAVLLHCVLAEVHGTLSRVDTNSTKMNLVSAVSQADLAVS